MTGRIIPYGMSDFALLRRYRAIYVDKTEQIFRMASTPYKYFLARPRRFGKSLLVSTLYSLFSRGLRDFGGLAIEKLWKDVRTYPVVLLDFSEIQEFRDTSSFGCALERYFARRFAPLGFAADPASVATIFEQFGDWLYRYSRSGQPDFVLLIDEYDAPLTSCLTDTGLFSEVRRILENFFKLFKANDGALRFMFIIGITKYSQTGIFSGLNNLADISWDDDYSTILGYTEEEIADYFADVLQNAARERNMPLGELLDELRIHYDGYCFDFGIKTHVYSPWSVLSFLRSPKQGFANYWFSSGGSSSLIFNYLKSRKLDSPASYAARKVISRDNLERAHDLASMNPDAFLLQTGYLTLKKVTPMAIEAGYPNLEVASSLASLYAEQLISQDQISRLGLETVHRLFEEGRAQDLVAKLNEVLLAADHGDVRKITSEGVCRMLVQIFLTGLGMIPRVEVHNAFGRSDMEVCVGETRWVLEFKYAAAKKDVTTKLEEAEEQILSRHYGEEFLCGKKLYQLALVYCGESRSFAASKLVHAG